MSLGYAALLIVLGVLTIYWLYSEWKGSGRP